MSLSASTQTRPDRSHGWQELATRDDDGLAIWLVWSKSADLVKVTVRDQRLDEYTDIDVDGADALSAFEHPFAYARPRTVAAHHTVHTQQTLRQQA